MNNKVCFVRINLFFQEFKLSIYLLFPLPSRISWLDLPRIRGATRMQRLELNPRLNTNKERARRPLNKSFPPRPPQRILTDPPHYLTTVMKKRTRDKSASSWLVTHQCLSGFVPIPTRHFSVTLTSLSSSLFVARARPIQLVHPSLLPTDWPELVTLQTHIWSIDHSIFPFHSKEMEELVPLQSVPQVFASRAIQTDRERQLRSYVDRGDRLTERWKKGTGRSGGVTRSRVANFPRPFLPSRVPNDLVPLWSSKRSLVETRSHVRQRSLWNTPVFVSSVLSKLREKERKREAIYSKLSPSIHDEDSFALFSSLEPRWLDRLRG